MKKKFVALFVVLLGCFLLNESQAQIISTIAGIGSSGTGGDGAPATGAKVSTTVQMMKYDAAGNLYFADGNRVREINTAGIISTVAGSTTAGYGGDGGPATAASLNYTFGIALDASGNLYISEASNHTVRKVTTGGIISTIAGNNSPGYSGDGFAATNAQINIPEGIALDASGNLYIADGGNNIIRKVTPAGIISTYAGNGTVGYTGDGLAATNATFNNPADVVFDGSGNLLIADRDNHVIRKVTTSGIISTFAGNGTGGYFGDGAAATVAELFNPRGIAIDISGNVLIADATNNVIRKVNASGIISTCVGTHVSGYAGDGSPATTAQINTPAGIAPSATGGYAFADQFNYRIRSVTGPVPVITGASTVCYSHTTTLTAVPGGGTWSSSNTTIAKVGSSSGIVSGLTAGSATISYTLGASVATTLMTVSICPGTLLPSSQPLVKGIHIYPNPNNGKFKLLVGAIADEEVKISIINIVGVKLREYSSVTNKETEIDLSGAPGIYFISATTRNDKYTVRILIE